MFTVFLAFVIFAEMGEKPPKLVAGYKTLDECLVAATSRNKNADHPWLTEINGGYVCLQMRGEA